MRTGSRRRGQKKMPLWTKRRRLPRPRRRPRKNKLLQLLRIRLRETCRVPLSRSRAIRAAKRMTLGARRFARLVQRHLDGLLARSRRHTQRVQPAQSEQRAGDLQRPLERLPTQPVLSADEAQRGSRKRGLGLGRQRGFAIWNRFDLHDCPRAGSPRRPVAQMEFATLRTCAAAALCGNVFPLGKRPRHEAWALLFSARI